YGGSRAIQVVVDDGRGGRDIQLFTIEVAAAPNLPPAFTTGPPVDVVIGQVYRYDALAVDPGGASLTFDLVVKAEGMAVQSTSGILVWTPTTDQVGTFDVLLRVSDGRGGVALQAFQVTASLPNTPPEISSSPPGPTASGVPYEYRVQAQDAE